MPHPYGDCQDWSIADPEKNVYEDWYPVSYTTQACQKTCQQAVIALGCQCLNPYLPIPDQLRHLPICQQGNVTQSDCLFQLRHQRMEKERAGEVFGEDVKCECPNACDTTMYNMDIS